MTDPKTVHDELVIESITVDALREAGADKLLREHTHELEPTMVDQLDPDWEAYSGAQHGGQLVVFAAWGCDKPKNNFSPTWPLVGYAVAAVVDSLHYYDHRICQMDVIYVTPEWRSRGAGLRLIRAVRTEARRLGAQCLIMHAKPDSRMASLLGRVGFTLEEVVFKENL